jgi:hypothetical protein
MMSQKMSRAATVCAVVIALAAPGHAAEKFVKPEATAKEFYRIYEQAHVLDIPDTQHRAMFKPVLSATLYALLIDADFAERRHAKRSENEAAPSLYEGDLFSSTVEGNALLKSVLCQADGDTAVCTASLHRFEETRTRGKVTDKELTWQDRLFLIRTAAGWRIDDIEYGGTWDFVPKDRLTAILKDVDKQSREEPESSR